ncbi:ATP-binding protein [Falsiroseomonas sp. HW251]|uniref:ATP-binding protein n=1 Tax=Falsiroseomonas sp. HW251 TaxID=3390998 RepID=UPI003D3173B3
MPLVLVLASLLVPALLFAAAAWQNRIDVMREGADSIVRTTLILQEHARKVFETQELALARVDDRVRDLTWDQIAAPETSAFLAHLREPYEQAVSIWVADRDGVVRAGSQPWDPAVTIADREFFRLHAAGDPGPLVSDAYRGRITAVASFALSRRRSTPDGRFDGTIHVALSPDYFSRFFAEAAPPVRHAAALTRADGAVLARDPPNGPARLGPASPLMQAIARNSEGGFERGISSVDGQERLFAYRRLGNWPLHVSFGVEMHELVARWRRNLVLYGGVAIGASMLLLLASSLAIQRARAERAASTRLAATIEELKRETAGREAAETRVRQAQRLEALGQLAGGIAHDVNNVLQAAASGARLIQRRPAEADQVKRLAGMVLEASERGASVARRLLAFARQGELRAAAVEARAMLEDLAEVLRHTLGAGIEVRLAVAAPLPPLHADKGQLETVLLNLATNARDAMEAGGVLTLSAGEERFEARNPAGLPPGSYLRLSVADTGAGMDAATLARASEPFFTTKPPGRGTGLGLAMARGFAEQSGGTLAIGSAPGRGTTVTLWLPRSEIAERAPAPDFALAARGAPRVLLVDDEPLVRETLAAELAERGWRVEQVSEGPAALAVLQSVEEPFDLLVTDLSMPGMNGLALIRAARRQLPGLPAVLLTGLVGDGTAAQTALAEAMRGGPFALLRKPIDARDLAARAEALLQPEEAG